MRRAIFLLIGTSLPVLAGSQTKGEYVTIWKKQSDGSWKIITDMGVPKD